MLFAPFPKIARFYRDIVVTEKLDGTNASIIIRSAEDLSDAELDKVSLYAISASGKQLMFAGSRTKLIHPGEDNFGFAAWVQKHATMLFELGEGSHFGEWWGRGIQRGYDVSDRRFSLFNVGRWNADNIPPCVRVVPTLYRGPMFTSSAGDMVAAAMRRLRFAGSIAAPGFSNPEGVIVFHTASGVAFKATFDGDQHKG